VPNNQRDRRSREKGLYDAARDFSFADLKGDLDSIGELCGGFRWEDSGAELAARRAARLSSTEHQFGRSEQ